MESVLFQLISDHIAVLKLNRPNAANALSSELLDSLQDAIRRVEKSDQIRVVILTGSGEKAFCAGADLKERKEMKEEEVKQAVAKIRETANMIEKMKVPVIAAINGAAYGGGLELALACDLRISARLCKMALTETSLGIIPGAGGTQRLSRLIGIGQAKKMILTAKPVTANKAYEIGLVEVIAEDKSVIEEAKGLAEIISRNAPVAVQLAKKSIQEGFDTALSAGLEIEASFYDKTIPMKDRLEGLRAFEEKRMPEFQGE